MNEKALRTLEYNKIIELLTEQASSMKAKELCRNLKPSTDKAVIEKNQQQTADALARLFQKGSISFSGIHDVEASLKRLEIGGTLSSSELLSLCSLLEAAKRIKAFSRGKDDAFGDSLDPLFDGIEPLTPLSDEIKRCIISEEEIADDASANLKNIRRGIHNMNDRVHTQMTAMLNNTNIRNSLQDGVITMRNGRY